MRFYLALFPILTNLGLPTPAIAECFYRPGSTLAFLLINLGLISGNYY